MSEQAFVLLNNTLIALAIAGCTAIVAVALNSPNGLWALVLLTCWQSTGCNCEDDDEMATETAEKPPQSQRAQKPYPTTQET